MENRGPSPIVPLTSTISCARTRVRRSYAPSDASMERRVRPVDGTLRPATLYRAEVNVCDGPLQVSCIQVDAQRLRLAEQFGIDAEVGGWRW